MKSDEVLVLAVLYSGALLGIALGALAIHWWPRLRRYARAARRR